MRQLAARRCAQCARCSRRDVSNVRIGALHLARAAGPQRRSRHRAILRTLPLIGHLCCDNAAIRYYA